MNILGSKQKPIQKVPGEYIAIIAGFLLLMTSVGFLILENREMIRMANRNAELYESVRAIDLSFIKVIQTGSLARRYVVSQSAGDLETYNASYIKTGQVINSTTDKIVQNSTGSISPDIKDVLLSILWELQKSFNSIHDVVSNRAVLEVAPNQNGNDALSGNDINQLIDHLYALHETKLSAVDRLREEQAKQVAQVMARNNMATPTGIIISIYFFILSFIILRNKMAMIRRYSLELEEETRRAQRAERVKSEFLANMSHEIRTPMTAILGFSELLSDGVEDPRYRSYLDGIQASGKALLSLINDILDLSKIEAGRITIKMTEMDLPSFISGIDLVFNQMSKNKGLEFTIQMAADVPDRIMADENRLRQILINLLGNAVKFTHQGFIKLTIFRQNNSDTSPPRICFAVSDSGIGISKDNQTLIFEAFRQVDGKTTRNYGGTGLGLSISLQLARLMEGTITLESEEGKGSTFTLELPLKEPHKDTEYLIRKDTKAPAGVSTQTTYQIRGGTVLIVENDPYNKTILREFLGKEQVRIFTANNGIEALNLLEQEHIDVVVTDIMMPKMSGIELIKLMKASPKLKDIPIIIASASTPPGEYQNIPGIEGFLRKPFYRSNFIALLAQYLPHEVVSCLSDEGATQVAGEARANNEWWTGIDLNLRKNLKETYEKRFKTLRITLSMGEIASFGKDLVAKGQSLHFDGLSIYGQALSNAAENLDISAINQLFAQFSKLIDVSENQQP